jgi:hypothetical protein
VTAKEIDSVGAQPTDPPWWRWLFLLVQGRDGQWWRGFALVALVGLLVVSALTALLMVTGWTGGALSALSALVVAWRRRSGRHSGRR